MMTITQRLGIGSVVLFVLLGCSTASAQEVTLGYQFQRLTADGEGLNLPLGFNVDVAGRVSDSLDIIGQVDWSRRSESEELFGISAEASLNLTSFGGGVRWNGRGSQNATPFVQALFGASRASFSCEVEGISCADVIGDTSETNAMFQVGAGVAVPVGPASVVGQVDYRRIFTEDEGLNGFRLLVGIRLGTR